MSVIVAPANGSRAVSNCPVSPLPYLSDLWNPVTGTHMAFEPWLYTGSAPLERASTAYTVPGADASIDPMGAAGNPVTPRTLTVRFLRPYDAGEDWYSVMSTWHRMVAHGRLMQAARTMPDQSLQFAWLKFLSTPEELSIDEKVRAVYAATFQLNPPYWQDAAPPDVNIYGLGGLVYGLGNIVYGTTPHPLPTATNTFQLDLRGATWPESAPVFTVVGPFGGDGGFQVRNMSAYANPPTTTFLHALPPPSLSQQLRFTVAAKLANASDQIVIRAGANSIRRNGAGAPQLLTRPAGQLEIFHLEPGIVNDVVIECVGANPTSGGKATILWYRKYV